MSGTDRPLFFIHIPKTAGTSFREAAVRKWGVRKVWSDYGDSRHTSEIVRQLVHRDRDYFKFKQQLTRHRIRLLSGHAPVRFFRRIFGAGQLVTLLRDPVARTFSHYQTSCSKQGFKGSFEDFCAIEENHNVQSRYLEQIPLELIGLIGLTERYDDSLLLFNKSYNCKLKTLKLNRQDRPAVAVAETEKEPDEAMRELAAAINQDDLLLYKVAVGIFEKRFEMLKQGIPYVHGKVQSIESGRIEGWAINHNNPDNAVELNIHVNGQHIASKPATEYMANMKERNVGRDGYVGFIHTLAQPLQPEDKLKIEVAQTGQILRTPKIRSTEGKEGTAAEKADAGKNNIAHLSLAQTDSQDRQPPTNSMIVNR